MRALLNYKHNTVQTQESILARCRTIFCFAHQFRINLFKKKNDKQNTKKKTLKINLIRTKLKIVKQGFFLRS